MTLGLKVPEQLLQVEKGLGKGEKRRKKTKKYLRCYIHYYTIREIYIYILKYIYIYQYNIKLRFSYSRVCCVSSTVLSGVPEESSTSISAVLNEMTEIDGTYNYNHSVFIKS